MSRDSGRERDYLAAQKYRKYLRQTGRPSYIRVGPETAWVHRKLNAFYERGMSMPEMARQSGLSISVLYRLMRNDDVGMLRSTMRRIEAMGFVQAEHGHIGLTGTSRRIGALWADGFTLSWLSAHLGVEPKHVYNMVHRRGEFVTVAMARRVSEAYDGLREKTPDEFGVPGRSQALARLHALRAGYAPRRCWDADTIDDPEAIPEWTGRCGTFFGWQIHEQEGIPVCGPCAAARDSGQYVLSSERLRQARHDAGLLITDVSRITGIKQATIQSWESGRSKPRFPADLEKVLIALDVTFEQVAEREEQS